MKEEYTQQDYDPRRVHPRKPYKKEVVFAHSETIYRGAIENISLGGARIETSSINQLDVGEMVTVSIPFSNDNRNIKRQGRIIWLNNTGFAIEFI
jgi:hypothetical protein